MHPLFVALFLDSGTDDALAEEDRRRTARRSRRMRVRQAARVTVRDRDRLPAR